MTNPRNANGHRRRRLRARVIAHYRDCALCGRPVDKTLHHLDPGAPEVDEIIPVSPAHVTDAAGYTVEG